MIYFDNAATTFPKPLKVRKEMLTCLREYCANPGRGSHNMAFQCELRIMECRENLAKLFNIPNYLNIIFTNNATEGLNLAIRGILKKGDHVITTQIEHNSVLRPLKYCFNNGVEVTILKVDEKGYLNIQDLKKSFKNNTKLVIINHGSNVIGTLQDLKLIGNIVKQNNAIFMVDGSQTAGVVKLDVQECNIDILAFPGHKGLLGPQGTGGIYISDASIVDCFKMGGTGSISNSLEQPDFLPDKFESGTLNTPGIVGLNEGVKFILNKGIDNIREHETKLMECITEELKKLDFIKLYGELDPRCKAPVISFNMDRFDSSDVGSMLNKNGICVRTGYHCAALIHKAIGTENKGTIRISPGYFNNFNEIYELINVIISINKQR